MNTKYEIGQRVSFPVRETRTGNIDSIQICKGGKVLYSVGGKMVDESELTAEHRENLPGPTCGKFYCIRGRRSFLTKGKIYETDKRWFLFDDGFNDPIHVWEEEHFSDGSLLKDYLVPLIRRPAKVGEYVYVTDAPIRSHEYTPGRIYAVKYICGEDAFPGGGGCVYFGQDGHGFVRPDEYLVLDGYRGESEAEA